QRGRSAMDRLLSPQSIVMIGASNKVANIGGHVFANLVRAFDGPVRPVTSRDETVQGVAAYKSVLDLPDPVDLAVVAVPARHVPGALQECADRGVGGAAVITAGFAEAGEEGVALQNQMTDVVARTGLRVIGPNCMGFMNLWGGVMANFALPPTVPLPPPGPVALVSQSGGFGSYITTKAMLAGLKLGWFVSTGNESDVNIAAVLRYLVDRDETKVLMVFAETLRDPDVFVDAACRAAELDKPIVLLKAGRSDAAAKAAMSHTASIVGSADVLDAVCRQYGVFVVSTMEEMLDLGTIFQDGRRVTSRGVGIMTSSGGAGVLLADAASAQGLEVPEIPADEQEAMMALMPEPFYGSLTNPVDTTAQVVAMPESFAKVLHAVGESRVVDMVAPVIWAVPGPQTDSVIEFYQGTDKPVALTSTAWLDELQVVGIPTYTDPHRAMHALGAVADLSLRTLDIVDRSAWHPNPERVAKARELLARHAGHRSLLESTSKELLALYGIPVTEEVLVESPDEAVGAAEKIDGPVALKVMSYDLPHKTEYGAIRLGLRGADAVRIGFEEMVAEVAAKAPDAARQGVLVQQMVPARFELTAGIHDDPVFGPTVVLGLGGILIEILSETAMLRPPFTFPTAQQALAGLLGGRLVEGGRGLSDTEQQAVGSIMVALGQLALEVPEVTEVDVNPIRVADGAVCAADALVVVGQQP
ncbi:MAG TPA: acetate--CoA ligase family protein, partial [Acidimicrobiales bacterium]|nr:acetate--CoA ligase family protein [Acidimicrobiales bacterium]